MRLLLVSVLALGVVTFDVGGKSERAVAARKKKNRNNRGGNQAQRAAAEQARRAIQQRVEQAKRELAASQQRAATAHAAATQAQAKAAAAASALKAAQAEAKAATEYLQQLEHDLASAQGPDTPYGQAKAAFEAAQSRYKDLLAKVIDELRSSPEYREALQSSQRAVLVSRLRKKALEGNAELDNARFQLEYTERRFAKARRELLAENNDWKAASERVRQAQAAMNQAKQALKGGLLTSSAARDVLGDTGRISSQAQRVIESGSRAAAALKKQAEKLRNNNRYKNRNRRKGGSR